MSYSEGMEIVLADEAATQALGAAVARILRAGDAVCLTGPLGAGKSSFARALIRELTSPDEEVPSPTYTLVQAYQGPDFEIAHFDLYRLEDPEEIYEIGWEDALSGGVALVEWPQRLGTHVPPNAKRIRIETLAGESRRITIDE